MMVEAVEAGGVAHPQLRFDPAWVVVPLIGDEVCTVLAHDWVMDQDDMVFRVRLDGCEGVAREVVRLPARFVGADFPTAAGQAPDLHDSGGLASYVLLDEMNRLKEFEYLPGGLSFRVLTWGWHLEGSDAVFDVAFLGETVFWRDGFCPPRPWYWRNSLRFPLSLLGDFDAARHW